MAEMFENPFTPSFGEVPAIMAGRQQVISDLRKSFDSATRRPELTTLISGARGTGKTALLALAAEMAAARGWVVANITAVPGMLDDILERSRAAARELVAQQSDRRVTGVGIGVAGASVNVTWDRAEHGDGNWRTQMTGLLDVLSEHGTGLLITVDEVRASEQDLILLAANYQQFVREGRKVGLIMAGLPHYTSALIQDESVSFLRRAHQVRLAKVPDYEVESALRKTIIQGGRTASDEQLARCIESIEGFPYMLQLVGYRVWDANPFTEEISDEDTTRGIAVAKAELRDQILLPTLADLSTNDREFLKAMLADEGSSALEDIARRMGKTSSYASQYKRRLLEEGVIVPRLDGRLAFALSPMRDILREFV